jgi:hypothetical protein
MASNTSTKRFEGLLWALAVLGPILAAIVTDRHILGTIAAVWILSMAVVIPLHLLKAWHRLPTMGNKSEYAAWVGFETACVIAFISLVVYGLVYKGAAIGR